MENQRPVQLNQRSASLNQRSASLNQRSASLNQRSASLTPDEALNQFRTKEAEKKKLKQMKLDEENRIHAEKIAKEKVIRDVRLNFIKTFNPASKLFNECVDQIENNTQIQNNIILDISKNGNSDIKIATFDKNLGNYSRFGIDMPKDFIEHNIKGEELIIDFENTLNKKIQKGAFQNWYLVGKAKWTLSNIIPMRTYIVYLTNKPRWRIF